MQRRRPTASAFFPPPTSSRHWAETADRTCQGATPRPDEQNDSGGASTWVRGTRANRVRRRGWRSIRRATGTSAVRNAPSRSSGGHRSHESAVLLSGSSWRLATRQVLILGSANAITYKEVPNSSGTGCGWRGSGDGIPGSRLHDRVKLALGRRRPEVEPGNAGFTNLDHERRHGTWSCGGRAGARAGFCATTTTTPSRLASEIEGLRRSMGVRSFWTSSTRPVRIWESSSPKYVMATHKATKGGQ